MADIKALYRDRARRYAHLIPTGPENVRGVAERLRDIGRLAVDYDPCRYLDGGEALESMVLEQIAALDALVGAAVERGEIAPDWSKP